MSIVIHIIDEDAAARGVTSFFLASQGYSPRVYGSVGEFLSSVRLHDRRDSACILLSVGNGSAACCEVRDEMSRRGIGMPLIGMSAGSDMVTAVNAMKGGAADFLPEPVSESDLISAIERAIDGGSKEACRHAAQAAARARVEALSPRERQILRGLLAGMSNKAIARRLDVSPRTVEMHRANMMADLALSSLAEAIRLAIEAELDPLEQSGACGAPTAEALRPPPQIKPARRSPSNQGASLAALLPPVLDALEGTTDCVFLLDRDFNFTYFNSNAVAAIAGGRELVGSSLWSAFPRTEETRAAAFLRAAADQRKSVRFDFFHPDLARWFEVNVRPIPSGLQVFFRDLTIERGAAAALRGDDRSIP